MIRDSGFGLRKMRMIRESFHHVTSQRILCQNIYRLQVSWVCSTAVRGRWVGGWGVKGGADHFPHDWGELPMADGAR